MTTPTTDAGRALADSVESLGYDAYDAPHFLQPPRESWGVAILAIEQEAVTRVLDALAREVERLREADDRCAKHYGNLTYRCGCVIERAAVLALFREHRPKGGPG